MEDTETPAKPTLWGIRRSAFIEIGVYLGVALLLDEVVFSGARFRQVSPHPFWPIVLLTAAQYGTAEALIAATVATAVLFLGRLPEPALLQDGYDYLLTLVSTPVQWLVAAVAIGELRMRHVRERDAALRGLELARVRELETTAAYNRLTAIKDDLETRIAGQLRSAITMYQAARSLEKMDTSEVLLGVMEVVRVVMNPEKFSLYLFRDNVLEVSIGEGWAAEDSLSGVFTADSPLFQEVIARRRIVCAASAADERILADQGVLAGPLADRETGQVIGMLKIEQIGFFGLHFSNVQTFSVLCDWIADAYVNARRFESAQSDAFVEPATRLLSYAFYKRQEPYLRDLAQAEGFSLSILLLRVDNKDALPANELDPLRARSAAAARHVLRATDLAFDGGPAGCLCCILMPGTTMQEASRIGDQIIVDLKKTVGAAALSYTVQTVEPVRSLGGRARA